MRVVLDTNIIVSALLFRGEASIVHEAWVEGAFALLVSQATLSECRRVLAYPKFRLDAESIRYLLDEEILPFAELVMVDDPSRSWIPEYPDDDSFIELALKAEADCLVSGDAHILGHRGSLPCAVFSLQEFLPKLRRPEP